MRKTVSRLALASAACALAACGGGGGGGGGNGLVSTPTPIPTPPPGPTATPTPFGISADTLFATVGDDVEFRWVESAKSYEIRIGAGAWERLTAVDTVQGGFNVYPTSSLYGVRISQGLGYQYTNLALQFDNGWGMPIGLFAYGLPTAAGNVPVTGTASYQLTVSGRAGQGSDPWAYRVGGVGQMSFDFAAGTLGGRIDPTIDNWTNDVRALGSYDFVNTVHGVGSTSFAGALKHGSLDQLGSFTGLFTGPLAAELMAEWQAPFRNPWTQEQGTMTGVWLGKKAGGQ